MKKLRFILPLFALCVLFLTGCKKEEIFKTFTQPYWHEEINAEYTATMTAVVTLPQEIGTYIQEGDELAAFINGECRGVAKNIDGLNYIMIKGMEKPNKFDPFGQKESAHLIYHTIAPLKVLVMGVNFILPF